MCNKCKRPCCKLGKICLITFIIAFAILIVNIIFLCNNDQENNILTATAVETDNPEIGITTIKFSKNIIQEGTAITHVEGSDSFIVNESGIYQISYQLFGTRDTIGTFNFESALSVNDTVLLDTLNDSPILRDNVVNRMTLTSTVLLQLNAGDVLKLQGISVDDIRYANARIDIKKV